MIIIVCLTITSPCAINITMHPWHTVPNKFIASGDYPRVFPTRSILSKADDGSNKLRGLNADNDFIEHSENPRNTRTEDSLHHVINTTHSQHSTSCDDTTHSQHHVIILHTQHHVMTPPTVNIM